MVSDTETATRRLVDAGFDESAAETRADIAEFKAESGRKADGLRTQVGGLARACRLAG